MAYTPHIDLEKEPFGAPAAGSALLHAGIVASMLLYGFIAGHLRHSMWGSNQHEGAIQATLVSSAPALPLPQDQPPTPNVLATETPSPAPVTAPPQPKAAPKEDAQAIPIPLKQPPKTKQQSKQQVQAPPKPVPRQTTDTRSSRYAQQVPEQQNRANYGQAAPQTARSMSNNVGPESTISTPGGDFGSLYPWYVDIIKRTVAQHGHQAEIDPSTPSSARVYVIFNVSRDGVPSGVKVDRSSGSPTLDSACVRAVQRVDTFGGLPPGYNQSSLRVQYYCEGGAFNR